MLLSASAAAALATPDLQAATSDIQSDIQSLNALFIRLQKIIQELSLVTVHERKLPGRL